MSNEQIVHNFEIPNVFSNSQQPVIVQLQPGQPLPPGAVVVNPQHINNSQQVFQPPQPNVQAQSTREWTTSLFECTKDEETCWWGLWYCWLVNARSIHSFGLSTSFSEIAYFWSFVVAFILSTLLFGIFGFVIFGSVLTALYAYRRSSYRSEIRTRFHIHGSNSDDFLTSCLCPCCAVCQEAREGKAVNVPVLDFCSGEELKIQQESHERAVGGLNVTEGSVSVDNGSLMDHVYALSKTSRIILIAWIGVFVIASLILLATKRGLSVVVMFLIFAQPLLILYFVYWRSRRMYAALDYVVKLFAVGFWVSTFQSIVLEAALQFVIVLILSPFAGGTPDEDATDDEKRDLLAKHMGVVVIAMLCMAFIVAAGVEETMKHFAVRCCRFSSTIQSPHTILVYLMTAALGFATSENIEYVFSATADPGEKQITMFYQEVTVYALRILMPIHVICSVMQAANLSRVVTGLKSMNLFQILLPALLLHGSFDFILFLLGALSYVYPDKASQYDTMSIVFAILITVGGLIGAIYMFNKVLKEFETTVIGQLMNAHQLGGGYVHEQLPADEIDDDVESNQRRPQNSTNASEFNMQRNPLNGSYTNAPDLQIGSSHSVMRTQNQYNQL